MNMKKVVSSIMAVALIGTSMATVPASAEAEVQDTYQVSLIGQIGEVSFENAPSVEVSGDDSYSLEYTLDAPVKAEDGNGVLFLSTDIDAKDFSKDGIIADTGIKIAIDSIEIDGVAIEYTQSEGAYTYNEGGYTTLCLNIYNVWSEPNVKDIDFNFVATNSIKVNFTIEGLNDAIAKANQSTEVTTTVTEPTTTTEPTEENPVDDNPVVDEPVETPAWANAYVDFLYAADFGNLNADTVRFALAYINDDDIPELVICDDDVNSKHQIYTYANDKVTYMGENGLAGLVLYKERGDLTFSGINSDTVYSVQVKSLKDNVVVDEISYQYDKENEKYYVNNQEVSKDVFDSQTNEYESTYVYAIDYDENMYDITEGNVNGYVVDVANDIVNPTIGDSGNKNNSNSNSNNKSQTVNKTNSTTTKTTTKASSSADTSADTSDSGVASLLIALGLATISATALRKRD